MSENQAKPNQQHTNPYQSYPYYYYPQSSPAHYPAYNTRQMPPQTQTQQGADMQGMLPMQQSYIENILRLNRGKPVTVYMTFENNSEWNAKIFKGILEAAGRDHIILSDPETNNRYLLLMIYLDYVTFEGEVNYSYPFDGTGQLSNYPSR